MKFLIIILTKLIKLTELSKLIKLVCFLFFVTNSVAFANTYTFKKDEGKIEFLAKGWPSLLKINGTGEGVEGELNQVNGKYSGDLRLNLKSLKTGISLRDKHLKEKYLKVNEKGKDFATLKVVDFVFPEGKKGKVKLKAKLRLNNVEREVSIKLKLKPQGKGVSVKGGFDIILTDYGIEIPSFKGITVAEKVEISVDLKAISS